MTSVRRALLFGFLIWLIPFVAAFLIFPLRESSRPLFESIMPVAITVPTAVLGVRYLRNVRHGLVREGILLGLLWLAISIVIDAPLMLLGGPMRMTVGAYVADIGITYLIIPAVTVGLAAAQSAGSAQGSAASD